MSASDATLAHSAHLSRNQTEQPAPGHLDAELDNSKSEGTANELTAEDAEELQQIATVLTATISILPSKTNNIESPSALDPESPRPELDPNSQFFDFLLWSKALILALERQGVSRPRAGFTFKGLSVQGSGKALQTQKTVGSLFTTPLRMLSAGKRKRDSHRDIISGFDGTVHGGEMLIVLGRPGSGCTTFLKSICGQLTGLKLSSNSSVHYNGVPQHKYMKELRGDVIYNSENEEHFPQLTVGQTLRLAAGARMAGRTLGSLSSSHLTQYVADIAMKVFGLSHVRDTRVGDDLIRGVSGGERKRVSIAETAISRVPIAAWDNSTKGLDAATALNFARTLKVSSEIWGTTHAVAAYQASQSMFDLFDKTIVLYEGRQVFFGPAHAARQYFEEMGWYCRPRQTTADFLTAVTSPSERQPQPGCGSKVPRTPCEFEDYWRASMAYQECLKDIARAESEHAVGGPALAEFQEFHRLTQTRFARDASPYRISIPSQIRLCLTRAYQLMWNEKAPIATRVFSNVTLALIIGSIFYNTPATTEGFYAKGSILYMSVLISALMSLPEIVNLYSKRPIVQKHARYAFYHPFTEAIAGVVADIPIKMICTTSFSLILYFLGGLRPDVSAFFIFYLFSFLTTLTMSAIFRTMAASTPGLPQAMGLAGMTIFAIAMYTGFTLRRAYMHPWFKWISYINPISYTFEALLLNEMHNQHFPCAPESLVPPYGTGKNLQCAVSGSISGEISVSGDAFANASYGYSYSHLWRNLGILCSFMGFFYCAYFLVVEFKADSASTGEHLIFRHAPSRSGDQTADEEKQSGSFSSDLDDGPNRALTHEQSPKHSLQRSDVYTWQNITLDVPVKGGTRRLLQEVCGWAKPGTLTALMGVSGAGKTTLLDTLAQRMQVGVLTGDMLVNGRPLALSFQRSTGYVQQQDLHLATTTVREALRFSAMLRQPRTTSTKEKFDWVEKVIEMLDMQEFSEAIVGEPGEGLNVEQRKRLTIGVELAAKPSLLLFLDEPTSGLDSTSSWAIIALLRRIADSGQAIISTIHQPSTLLFQQFDRLLLLGRGGRTVYFGDIGQDSRVLLDYFQNRGARSCGESENPAEYVLDIVESSAREAVPRDWAELWLSSKEVQVMKAELSHLHENSGEQLTKDSHSGDAFALPLHWQAIYVWRRTLQSYWRTPSYVMGKLMLATVSALFTGFSFYNQDNSIAGMQNCLFAIFMVTTVFTPLVQQIMPRFLAQRSLYEGRERPSKCYSWIVFMLSNIMVELLYQYLAAVLVYVAWYWAVFGTGQATRAQGLMLLFCLLFYIFIATFAIMVIAALPDVTTAANVATLLFSMMLLFEGILQPPSALPTFWKFMWRTSPLTYLVGSWAATGVSGRTVQCARNELAIFDPPQGMSCIQYLTPYLQQGAPGHLVNPSSYSSCEYCPLTNGNQFLAGSEIYQYQTGRNIGLLWVYIGFNILAAMGLYYVFRVQRRFRLKSLFGLFGRA